MRSKIISLVLIVSSLLPCSAACGSQEMTISAEDIIKANIAATNTELITYHFAVTQILHLVQLDVDWITQETAGMADVTNEEMYKYGQRRIASSVEGEPETIEGRYELYFINDWIYGVRDTSNGMSWCKRNMEAGQWMAENLPGQQFKLLREYVDVELLDTEIINGIECYKINVTPDINELWVWAEYQHIHDFLGTGGEIPENVLEDSSTSITVWIDKETYFVVKTDIHMTFWDGQFEISTTMLLWDFNTPINISVPEELVNTDICSSP